MNLTTVATKGGLVLEAREDGTYVLREGGLGAMPPYQKFIESPVALAEPDLVTSSKLMKTILSKGGDVDFFQRKAQEWLEKRKKSPQIRSQAKALAQRIFGG